MVGRLIFSIGSLTDAMRAKRGLNGIRVDVVKIDSSRSRNGCAYGIEFSQKHMYEVAHRLNQMDITYQSYSTSL